MDGLEEKGKIVRNQNNWKLAGQRTETERQGENLRYLLLRE